MADWSHSSEAGVKSEVKSDFHKGHSWTCSGKKHFNSIVRVKLQYFTSQILQNPSPRVMEGRKLGSMSNLQPTNPVSHCGQSADLLI